LIELRNLRFHIGFRSNQLVFLLLLTFVTNHVSIDAKHFQHWHCDHGQHFINLKAEHFQDVSHK
jgi:hypothetical protein